MIFDCESTDGCLSTSTNGHMENLAKQNDIKWSEDTDISFRSWLTQKITMLNALVRSFSQKIQFNENLSRNEEKITYYVFWNVYSP